MSPIYIFAVTGSDRREFFWSMPPLGVQYMSATKGDTLQEIAVCMLDVTHTVTNGETIQSEGSITWSAGLDNWSHLLVY